MVAPPLPVVPPPVLVTTIPRPCSHPGAVLQAPDLLPDVYLPDGGALIFASPPSLTTPLHLGPPLGRVETAAAPNPKPLKPTPFPLLAAPRPCTATRAPLQETEPYRPETHAPDEPVLGGPLPNKVGSASPVRALILNRTDRPIERRGAGIRIHAPALLTWSLLCGSFDVGDAYLLALREAHTTGGPLAK